MKRRSLRRVNGQPKYKSFSTYPLDIWRMLTEERDAATLPQTTLYMIIDKPQRATYTAFNIVMIMVSFFLFIARLILKYQVWPFSLLVLTIYITLSIIKKKLIFSLATFIILLIFIIFSVIPV